MNKLDIYIDYHLLKFVCGSHDAITCPANAPANSNTLNMQSHWENI